MPDHSDTLNPGDVLVIDRFDLQKKGGPDKPIWAIYLGRDGVFDCPIFIYFCRTTTQCNDFGEDGNRAFHRHKKFAKGEFGFEKECLIDYDEPIYTDIPREKFNSYSITVKGHLPNNILLEIWNACIKNNKYLNNSQKTSIRNSFNKFGITVK